MNEYINLVQLAWKHLVLHRTISHQSSASQTFLELDWTFPTMLLPQRGTTYLQGSSTLVDLARDMASTYPV